MELDKIYQGDATEVLKTFPDESIDCVITSPPYWGLRDYGQPGQLGMEDTPEEYTANMVKVFSEIKRVLKKTGTLWLNLGDSYAGSGRGLDGDGTWNPGKGDSKQETHRNNQQQMRKVNEHSFSKKRMEQGAIGNKWVKPPKGLKQKDLVGIPWRVAFALQSDGWYLRQDIIWSKPNPMPESVTDRCTKSHEYIFLLTKSGKYYYDADSIAEPMAEYERQRRLREREQGLTREPLTLARDGQPGMTDQSQTGAIRNLSRIHDLAEKGTANKRSVWTIATKPFAEAHFATFPPELIQAPVKAGCPKYGVVLDPFMGSGTTAVVARLLSRRYVGIELNPEYIKIAQKRLSQQVMDF